MKFGLRSVQSIMLTDIKETHMYKYCCGNPKKIFTGRIQCHHQEEIHDIQVELFVRMYIL